jgi:hypothetical protein
MTMGVFAVPPAEFDSSPCAQEPIHIPGAIQPHGALLAAMPDGSRMTHASANLAAILGRPVEAALGQSLAATLGEAASETLLLTGLSDGTDLRRTLVCRATIKVRIELRETRSCGSGRNKPEVSHGAAIPPITAPRIRQQESFVRVSPSLRGKKSCVAVPWLGRTPTSRWRRPYNGRSNWRSHDAPN